MTWSMLSQLLWRERDLLELLLFKLDEEQLLLAAGRDRWLARAVREVELVLEEIRSAELVRSIEVEALARAAGLDANPSLAGLAESADEPWRGILVEHRAAFLELTRQISTVGALSTALSALYAPGTAERGDRAQRRTCTESLRREADDLLITGRSLFDMVGDPPDAPLDLQMREMTYRSALGSTARALQVSLLDFLR